MANFDSLLEFDSRSWLLERQLMLLLLLLLLLLQETADVAVDPSAVTTLLRFVTLDRIITVDHRNQMKFEVSLARILETMF